MSLSHSKAGAVGILGLQAGEDVNSEIAANVELPAAAIKVILSTGEGRPVDLELPSFHRGKIRRGLVG